MRFLRQSTASQEILLGPFVAAADGTPQTGLTIANTDIKLLPGGSTSESNKNSGGATHIAGGRYSAVLDATDTATVGILEVSVNPTSGIPWNKSYYVLEEAVYDMLFAASALGYVANAPVNVAQFGGANGTFASGRPEVNATHWGGTAVASAVVPANVIQISGDATAADNLESYCDGTTPQPVNVTQFGGSAGTFASGRPNVNASHLGGTSQTGRDIGASVLLSSGTGTGQVTLTSGRVNADITHIATAAVSTSTAQLGVNVVNAGGTAWGSGAITAASIASDAFTAAKFATDVGTEFATANWALGTRTLTAGTNIALAKGTGITGFNDLSAAQVNAEVDTALVDIHLDHLLAVTYDPASKPGAADALLNELVGNDGGVAQFTANALELAPSGGGGLTVQDIVDGVWDEPMASHADSGTTGEALAAAGGAGDPWITTLPGSYTGSQAGKILADILVDTGTTLQAELDGIQADTEDLQSRIPAALVGGRIDATVDGTGMESGAVSAIQSGLATSAELAKVPKSDSNVTWNATALASINTQVDTAFADYDPPTRAELTSDTNSVLSAVGDVPTNAELEARTLAAADYATATAVADLPTNAELATALSTADDAVLSAIAALNNLSSAQAQTAAAAALTAYDPPTRAEATSDANSILTAIGDVPTNAELATALAAADDAVLSAIAALNNISVANILAATVEGSTTLVQSLRLLNSALGGKASGLETTTAHYRDLADAKDRILATVDSDGNRTAVTLDLT